MNQARERREYLRANLNVFINEESRTSRLLAKVVDISERGVRYMMPPARAQRDCEEVTVEFSLPGDELPLRVLGRVVHDTRDTHVQDTAVEFTMLRSSDAERIRRYVGRRKRAELFEQMHREHMLQ